MITSHSAHCALFFPESPLRSATEKASLLAMAFRSVRASVKISFLVSRSQTRSEKGKRISFFLESAKAKLILFLLPPIFSFCAESELASGWKKSF